MIGRTIWTNLADPFYDRGPNDKGIGIQLAFSMARVGLGFLCAALVAIPLGFLIGMSPLIYRALNPFIQVLKPISPLAWMPLALYTIKDAAISSVFEAGSMTRPPVSTRFDMSDRLPDTRCTRSSGA